MLSGLHSRSGPSGEETNLLPLPGIETSNLVTVIIKLSEIVIELVKQEKNKSEPTVNSLCPNLGLTTERLELKLTLFSQYEA
jgi:hypothetical protein